MSYFQPALKADNTAPGTVGLFFTKDKITKAVKDEKTTDLNTIPNIDETYTNENGEKIHAIYGTPYSGLFVRHNENGKKYYQAHLKDGTPVGKQYPFESIVYMVNDSFAQKVFNYIIPFEIIDKERNLYWPILFLENNDKTAKFIERPEEIAGVLINPTYHWSDLYMTRKNLMMIPGFNEVGFLHKDAGGSETLIFNEFNIDKLKNFYKIETFLTQKLDQRTGDRYFDLSLVSSKDITYDGRFYDRKFPVFKNKNGKYVYASYGASYTKETTFDTKEQALQILEARAQNIQQIANLKKQQYIKTENDIRQANYESNKIMNDHFQNIKDSNAAAKAQYNAQRKAENAAIWNRVGQQIQQSGQDASKRAKCINKRTQTKKDYLAGKQGWYDVGGCQ